MTEINEIEEAAAKLSEEDRAALASRLLHSLSAPVYEVTDEEVMSRVREGDEDPDSMLTFDELVSDLGRHGN